MNGDEASTSREQQVVAEQSVAFPVWSNRLLEASFAALGMINDIPHNLWPPWVNPVRQSLMTFLRLLTKEPPLARAKDRKEFAEAADMVSRVVHVYTSAELSELGDHPDESSFLKHLQDIYHYSGEISEALIRSSHPEAAKEIAASLRATAPDQKVGPAQFQIIDGKVRVDHRTAHPSPDSAAISHEALAGLIASGDQLSADLEGSNLDRRILRAMRAVHAKLQSGEDIVQLGMLNLSLEMIVSAAADELPAIAAAELRAFSVNLSMYLAQFPDWAQFIENAAAVELSAADVELIAGAARDLKAHLEKAVEVVDPEVPATIAGLQALLKEPKLASKRAAFAVLRTIENFIASIGRFTAEFVTDLARQTATKSAKRLSTVAVGALMLLAADAAIQVSPAASKVAESAWVRGAADLLKKQLEHFRQLEGVPQQ